MVVLAEPSICKEYTQVVTRAAYVAGLLYMVSHLSTQIVCLSIHVVTSVCVCGCLVGCLLATKNILVLLVFIIDWMPGVSQCSGEGIVYTRSFVKCHIFSAAMWLLQSTFIRQSTALWLSLSTLYMVNVCGQSASWSKPLTGEVLEVILVWLTAGWTFAQITLSIGY